MKKFIKENYRNFAFQNFREGKAEGFWGDANLCGGDWNLQRE
jgi:hypothetical protein